MQTAFRTLALICLATIIVLSALTYTGRISAQVFSVSSAVIAVTASILEVLSNRPVTGRDVSVAVDRVLTTYDGETLLRLREAKQQERELQDFIERKSNEIFLLRLRTYLEDEIVRRYSNSELPGLVEELSKVEEELDRAQVTYNEVDLPDRFKRVLANLERQDRLRAYLQVIDAVPFPYVVMPLKELYKLAVRLRFQMGDQATSRGASPPHDSP